MFHCNFFMITIIYKGSNFGINLQEVDMLLIKLNFHEATVYK